jgi:hypothetical protein
LFVNLCGLGPFDLRLAIGAPFYTLNFGQPLVENWTTLPYFNEAYSFGNSNTCRCFFEP